MAIRWGLSVLDWRSHAIDERRMHPVGVFKAECGHLLMMVTTLHDRPTGKPCEACAAQQFVQAVKGDSDQFRANSDAPLGLHVPAPKFPPMTTSSSIEQRLTTEPRRCTVTTC